MNGNDVYLEAMEREWGVFEDGSEVYGDDKLKRLEDMQELAQERSDEIRKDDSEPDFLADHIQVCSIDPDCEACS